jgi:microcystin degradation protein MlrC
MRLFAASLATETNTFSPIPTDRSSFRHYPPGQHPERPSHTTAPLWVARKRAAAEGFKLIEGSCFWANPSGLLARSSYETMRDEILEQLRSAMPVDGVLLGLHGAMTAHGYDDCEADIIERVRAIVGPDVAIGVELDPHCHLTRKRVQLATVIILYKEYPHVDFVERAEELLTLLLRTIRGEIRPVASLYDLRMMELFPTNREPGRSFVDRMIALEGKDGVLSVSLGQGFQKGDVPEHGMRMLVYTDGRKDAGDRLARMLGEEVRGMKGRIAPTFISIDEAIDRALASNAQKPIVVGDMTDNAGAGAASDNTNVIRRLIERQIEGAVVLPVWDPVAVSFCSKAGLGADMELRFGGKAAATSSSPIDAQVKVIGLAENPTQRFGDAVSGCGPSAAIRLGGLDVVLVTERVQAIDPELMTQLGIDYRGKRFIGVKSANHFQALYAPIAAETLYCDGGGPCHVDLRKYPFRRIERPLWPHDPLPEGRLLL